MVATPLQHVIEVQFFVSLAGRTDQVQRLKIPGSKLNPQACITIERHLKYPTLMSLSVQLINLATSACIASSEAFDGMAWRRRLLGAVPIRPLTGRSV